MFKSINVPRNEQRKSWTRLLSLKHGRSFIAISSSMNGPQLEVFRMSLFLLKFGANVRLGLEFKGDGLQGLEVAHFFHIRGCVSMGPSVLGKVELFLG